MDAFAADCLLDAKTLKLRKAFFVSLSFKRR